MHQDEDIHVHLVRRIRRTTILYALCGFLALAVMLWLWLGWFPLGRGLPAPTATTVFSTATAPTRKLDGQLIFEEWGAGGSNVYRINPDGSERAVLTRAYGNTLLPRLSPDGRMLALVAAINDRASLVLIDLTTGTGRRLVTAQENDLPWIDLAWSADSQQLAVVRAFKSISSAGSSGGSTAYTGIEEGPLSILGLNGTAALEISGRLNLTWSPQWTPDGKAIFFNAVEYGYARIYSIRPDGSDLRVFGAPDATMDQGAFALSPDGNQIVYLHLSRTPEGSVADQLVLARLDGSAARVLKSFESAQRVSGSGAISFSPDGSQLLYVAPDSFSSALRLLDLTSGEDTLLFHDPNVVLSGRRPVWSPDGQSIAFSSGKAIYIVPAQAKLQADAQPLFQVYESSGFRIGAIQWSGQAIQPGE